MPEERQIGSVAPRRRIPIAVHDVQEIRRFVERASKAVSSQVMIRREAKVPILADLAKCRRICDAFLQLSLFSDAQLLNADDSPRK